MSSDVEHILHIVLFRVVHHGGVPPTDLAGPGSGLFPKDEVCAEL